MRTHLLEFLFGKRVTKNSEELGESIVRLFEEADEIEGTELVQNKKGLSAALKSLGISGTVEAGVQSAELHCDNDADYREHIKILSDPESIHKLAEMGWVSANCGDQAMSNEAPDFKIRFIEIQTTETGDADKPDQKLAEIIKQGREFATEPMKSDDDLNPVEHEPVKESAHALVHRKLNEMTSCSAIPPVESPMGVGSFRSRTKKARKPKSFEGR